MTDATIESQRAQSVQAVNGLIAIWNDKDLDRLGTVVADDYLQHHPGAPQGLAGLRDYMAGQFKQLEGLAVRLDDLVCERDRAVARLWLTFSRDGQPAQAQMIDVWRVADGKLAEHWSGDPTPMPAS